MKRLACLIALLCLVGLPGSASAHVFFTDQTGQSGVIMHVVPDDDPIAGSETDIYFDIQDEALSTTDFNYSLSVQNQDGDIESAATYPTGKYSAAAKYTFAEQGVYQLILRADPVYIAGTDASPAVFEYTQRVSRGRAGSPLDEPRYAWAELGLVVAAGGLAVVLAVAVGRRKRIIGYTK